MDNNKPNIVNRKSVNDKLSKFTYSDNDSDFIEITQWANSEGYDITICENNVEKHISISSIELEAINYLTKVLEYE